MEKRGPNKRACLASPIGRRHAPWYHLNSRAGARALSTPLTEGNRLGLLTRLWTFSRAAHERLSTGPARELTPWRACCPPPLPLWAFETDILTRSLLFLALFDIKQHHTTPPTVCQPGRRKEADFFCFSQRSGKERKINFERLHKREGRPVRRGFGNLFTLIFAVFFRGNTGHFRLVGLL